MIKQLAKIELIKTQKCPTFWALILVHAILFILVILIGANINVEIQGINILDFFKAKYLWGTTAWVASWFNLLMGVLLTILVGNEIQFGTFRRQIIDGISRTNFLLGKLMVMLALSIYTIVLVSVTGFLTSLFTPQGLSSDFFINFKVVFVLGLQTLGYMSVAMLFAFLFKSNVASSIFYLLYFILVEPIIRIFVPSPAYYFFPAKIISHLTPTPNFLEMLSENYAQIEGIDPNTTLQLHNIQDEATLSASIFVTIAYILVFLTTIFLIVRNKDC